MAQEMYDRIFTDRFMFGDFHPGFVLFLGYLTFVNNPNLVAELSL